MRGPVVVPYPHILGCLILANLACFTWTSVGLFRLQKSLTNETPSQNFNLWRRHSKNRSQAQWAKINK